MIYIITDIDLKHCKIGYSKNPEKRLGELNVASPINLVLMYVAEGDVLEERQVHLRFYYLRTKGEWFLYDKEILDYMENDYQKEVDCRKYTAKELAGCKTQEEIDKLWLSYMPAEYQSNEDIDDKEIKSLIMSEVRSIKKLMQ